MNDQKPNIGIRLASMLIDHFVMCFILIAPVWAILLLKSFQESTPVDNLGPGFQFLFIGLMFIYFLKDSFHGKSIAKRMLKLQVVNNRTEMPASAVQCFVRNILIIVWPLEVIVTFFSPQRRLGDFIAGTKVVRSDYKPIELILDERS